MAKRSNSSPKSCSPARRNTAVASARARRAPMYGRRRRGGERPGNPFMPPEDWYEPTAPGKSDYRVIVQQPGRGYRHAVTARDVRCRLAELPEAMIASLEVVQLSRMTRKKRTFPCYGMQWGNSLYLYPIEEELIEQFTRPPLPAERQEATMYGGRWQQRGQIWRLVWTEQTVRDFYLNNVLIHELGHLLDQRNTGYADRERYAEWFAIEHGYKPSRRKRPVKCAAGRIARRHGS